MPNVFIHKAKKCRLYNKLMEILIDKIIIYILKYKIHVSINLDYIDILNPQIKKSLITKVKDKEFSIECEPAEGLTVQVSSLG